MTTKKEVERPLPLRRARFVLEYLVDLNGKQAAIRAGYSQKGADVAASRLLRNVQVQAAVDTAIERQAERTGIQSDEVLLWLSYVAFADISEAFDDNGDLLPLKKMPPGIRRAISGIEVLEKFFPRGDGPRSGKTKRIRFLDKVRALELLGKHLGLFVEVEHDVADGLAARLEAARKRVTTHNPRSPRENRRRKS